MRILIKMVPYIPLGLPYYSDKLLIAYSIKCHKISASDVSGPCFFFFFMLRDIEFDFSVNSSLAEVKNKLLTLWMFHIKMYSTGSHVYFVGK